MQSSTNQTTAARVLPADSRIPSLDGLRAISIGLVMLSHLYATRGFPISRATFPAAYDAMYGNLGVRIFFVISGFLITTILLGEHQRTGTVNLRKFYIRRAYRIFPPAYVYIAIIVLLFWKDLTFGDVARSVTYLRNWISPGAWNLGHLWSLSVEEQFYFLWPWLLAALFAFRTRIAIIAIAVAPLCRLVLFQYGLEDATTRFFPAVFDALSAGCLLAIMRPQLMPYSKFLSNRWMFVPIAVTFTLPVLYQHPHIYNGIVVTCLNFGIALGVYHCILREYWILNARPMVWVGTLSYSLYLWQQPFLNNTAPSTWTTFPLNVILAFAAATISYNLVEQPALRLRNRRETRGVTLATTDSAEPQSATS